MNQIEILDNNIKEQIQILKIINLKDKKSIIILILWQKIEFLKFSNKKIKNIKNKKFWTKKNFLFLKKQIIIININEKKNFNIEIKKTLKNNHFHDYEL